MTIYNFSAGPAVLPKDVLLQAQSELIDWHGSGMSVMEMSHRGKEYMGIHAQAEADLRELMGVPANYKVLFLQRYCRRMCCCRRSLNLSTGMAVACR